MEPLNIANLLKDRFPQEVIDITEYAGQISVLVKRERIKEIMAFLKESKELDFDHLQDLTAVDYKDKKIIRFEVVYQLFSIRYQHSIRIKAEVPEETPFIDTLCELWHGAGWHERECYDMFGIVFRGHPDLRRILMPEDWQGYPLRKDYPLKGPKEYWHGFQEVLQKAEEYRQHETRVVE